MRITLFSTLATLQFGLKMSLFLTQAAMNFALERQNQRKRSIQPDKTLVALELPLSMMVNSQYILIATVGMHTVVYKHAH